MRHFLGVAIVSIACSVSFADDPSIRSGVEKTLASMTAAATAGDADAWVANIASTDDLFLNEQRYFARDLKKKPPSTLEITMGEFTSSDGRIAGPLTWMWAMPDKPARTLSFSAQFIREGDSWKYAGETWNSFDAPGIRVMFDPGYDELAARTAEAFAAIRPHVEQGFELKDSEFARHTQQIKIYGSMKHLQGSICLSYEEGLSGWNEPGEPIKLLAGRQSSPEDLRRLLSHEYGHCATFALGPKANSMPWWVLEGVAELAAEGFGARVPDRQVLAWAKNGKLAAWNDLADFDVVPPRLHGRVYAQGHHMLSYISERWRRQGRNQWLTAMAQGKTIDEASREVMGLSFDDLDHEWRADLDKQVAAAREKEEEKQPAETADK